MSAPAPAQDQIAPAAAPVAAETPAVPPAAPAAAPAATNGHSNSAAGGAISDRDVTEWKDRFNHVLAKPSEAIHQRSPAGASAWHESFFGCFSPIDLCCITWCLPCITFGKTHHRLRRDANLEGYEPINTSVCLPRPTSFRLALYENQ